MYNRPRDRAPLARMAVSRVTCSMQAMTRSSTVTVRATPVSATSAASGGLVVRGDDLVVSTSDRIEVVDLTDRVMAVAGRFPIREGTLSLWSMHTTCALFINESQIALVADIKRFLEDLVARDRYYMHNDPQHSDCDRMNADSHIRALLLGHSLALQVSGAEVVLGRWQRVLMAELDGPRERTIRIQGLGLA